MAASKDENYDETFDADFYLKTYYSGIESEDGVTDFMMELYHDIFKSGEINGKTLLDIGTGPAISYIIEQCLKFRTVYVSDYPRSSRIALHQWYLDNKFHDFSPFFKCVAGKLQDGRTWEAVQDLVRENLGGILAIDIRQSNPLTPNVFPQFDAITSTFCLHAVPETLEEYRMIVRNVSSLLKPGGHMVESGHLEETYYCVKDTKYNVLYMNKEDVCKIWTEEGFTVKTWREYTPKTGQRKVYTDWKSIFCMVAEKNVQ